MTATNRHDAPTDPEPPTPGAAPRRQSPPCRDCGTTGGRIQVSCRKPWRAQGYCMRCYQRLYYHGALTIDPTYHDSPAHPGPIPAVVTPAMLGITRGQIRAGFLTAQAQLWADEARCIVAGAVWQQAHPEQFTAAHLAAIFGGDPAPAFWHDDAARAA